MKQLDVAVSPPTNVMNNTINRYKMSAHDMNYWLVMCFYLLFSIKAHGICPICFCLFLHKLESNMPGKLQPKKGYKLAWVQAGRYQIQQRIWEIT